MKTNKKEYMGGGMAPKYGMGGMMKKYLKGGQVKLDVNKDNKITGADFKIMKKK
jgi:hypothetical protein